MAKEINQEEVTLVRRAKKGDKEAFGQLMENHAVRVYRIAYSILQNQGEAEDAVQEAYITAFKSIKKVEKEESFGSWLGRIVTTRVYDLLRKKQRSQKAVESETEAFKFALAQASSNPANDTVDLGMDLQSAIKQLPELHRMVVMMRYTQDATTDQISRVLERPAGTIRRVLSESYQLLRLYLEGDEDHEVR